MNRISNLRSATLVFFWSNCLFSHLCTAAIEEFDETFDGNGQFRDIDGNLIGFDNPDWTFRGDGLFQDGGLKLENEAGGVDGTDGDTLSRLIFGHGSFHEQVEIRDVLMTSSGIGASLISLTHLFDIASGLGIWVFKAGDEQRFGLGIQTGALLEFHSVESGPDVALSIFFDEIASVASFSFDNNLDDDLLPVRFGPYPYDGSVRDNEFESTRLVMTASEGETRTDGLVDFWSLTEYSLLPGDFNNDHLLDVTDIDLLTAAMQNDNLAFDLTSDGRVDAEDRRVWVEELKKTYFGDSNLDGEFNSVDLVTAFQAFEYEDSTKGNSTWATGDWNGDAEFESSDLVFAFQDGGYEIGPRAAVRSVPEPPGVLFVFGVICLIQTSKASIRRAVY